jgi:hypothetical protein
MPFAMIRDQNDYKPMRGFGWFILDDGNVKHFAEIKRYCLFIADQTDTDCSKATARGINPPLTTHSMQGGHRVRNTAFMELLR